MPSVSNANLTLDEASEAVTITVSFIPVFSNFEKELAALGCTFDAHYSVHGVDNGVIGPELTAVSIPNASFLPGPPGLPAFPVVRSITVGRVLLQEDTAFGDNDEIKVKIVLHNQGVREFTDGVYTDQEILVD